MSCSTADSSRLFSSTVQYNPKGGVGQARNLCLQAYFTFILYINFLYVKSKNGMAGTKHRAYSKNR